MYIGLFLQIQRKGKCTQAIYIQGCDTRNNREVEINSKINCKGKIQIFKSINVQLHNSHPLCIHVHFVHKTNIFEALCDSFIHVKIKMNFLLHVIQKILILKTTGGGAVNNHNTKKL